MSIRPTDTSVSPKQDSSASHPTLFLLAMALAILVAFLFQGSRGLYESTEGRYAQCAKETLESGNLLEPMLDGAHHWSKPPLAYMAIAAGIQVFGNNAWGARIFQSLFFVLTVYLIYIAGRELWDPNAGALAALIYATSPFTAGASSTVSTDNMLTLFQCAAVAFFWLAMRRDKPVFVTLAWLALAFAFLTKGPVGLLPLAGLVPAYVVLRREPTPVPPFFRLSAVLTFFAVGLSWYLLEIIRHPELLDTWLMHETLGRFASDEFHRNAEFRKIFTLYMPIVLFGTGPWIFYLLFRRKGAGITWQAIRDWRHWDDRAAWTYVAAGTLLPLALFSASHSRLPLYLLPLFIPIALGMGKAFSLLVARGHFQLRTLAATACVLALLFIVAKAGAAYYPSRRNMAQLAEGLRPTLDEHAGKPLILVSGDPLNGLEFYLDRKIPMHAFPKLGEVASAPPSEADTLTPGTLVLARGKHLRAAAPFLPDGLFETLYEDSYWSLVELNKPINLRKQAATPE